MQSIQKFVHAIYTKIRTNKYAVPILFLILYKFYLLLLYFINISFSLKKIVIITEIIYKKTKEYKFF